MTRTPQEVFAHHGKALAAGDLDGSSSITAMIRC